MNLVIEFYKHPTLTPIDKKLNQQIHKIIISKNNLESFMRSPSFYFIDRDDKINAEPILKLKELINSLIELDSTNTYLYYRHRNHWTRNFMVLFKLKLEGG